MLKTICLALILGLAICEPSFETDGDVITLTDDNFQDVIDHYQNVLVKFYAPWCGHCKKLAPEYKTAATSLKESGSEARLAEVDCTEAGKDSCGKFGVQGYPTLKYFVGGQPIDYQGPREAAGITNWVKKKTEPSTILIDTADALNTAKTNNEVLVVFFGTEGSAEFDAFSLASKSFDDIIFNHVFNTEVAGEFGVDGTGLVLFKQFDEGRNDFSGDFTAENLKTFIDTNSVATIMRFSQKGAQLIFGAGKPCLFLFHNDGDVSDDAYAQLEEASGELKGNILMANSGISDGLDSRLAEYIGVDAESLPTVRIVDPSEGDIIKYVLQGDITAASINQFYQDFSAGNLSPFTKSEPVPESQEGAVFQLVGLNWNDVVESKDQDVLVKYYAPWCGHCKAIAPIYESLAEGLTGVSNLVIAEMDATANEVDGLSIKGFPTILFYPANNKTPLTFEGERTEQGFIDYLKSHSSGVVDWSSYTGAEASTEEETHEDL